MFDQILSKAGMRKHRDEVVQVLLKEFIELEDDDAFMCVDRTKITRQQKQKVLIALYFLKEKVTTF